MSVLQIEPISDDEEDYPDYHAGEPVLAEAEVDLNTSLEPSSEATTDPNHQLMILSNPRIGDGPGEYLCNVCNAKFVYKNNLKSHLKRHLGIYPYVCFCGKRYQFKCKLNKHIEQVSLGSQLGGNGCQHFNVVSRFRLMQRLRTSSVPFQLAQRNTSPGTTSPFTFPSLIRSAKRFLVTSVTKSSTQPNRYKFTVGSTIETKSPDRRC